LAIHCRHNVAAALRCANLTVKRPGNAFVERVLAAVHLNVRVGLAAAALAAGIAAIGLSACGRAGPLELPPGPAVSAAPSAQLTQPDGSPAPGSPQDAAVKTGFDTQGNPVATTGKKKTFILDPLLQ
jgi:predicted small lipoprotein YifL